MKSVFTEPGTEPTDADLQRELGETLKLWQDVEQYTLSLSPKFKREWKFTGKNYGWSFRISDSKRVVIYMLPREGFFKVGMVFGAKAADLVLKSNVSPEIKKELSAARVYAEGRGIRLEIKDASLIKDIKELIGIKIAR